ncbi:hypothetical protein FA15DRAFT_658675 [Coprinopsis marcescibilis]|uniref:Uncharacterized protein n=1 Tax=Coprinopsis marcescibilis TaxID=230819 RepID=A0A5C3KLH5_COPMA|nr:hypothetical protein FA15DRAFT_658675 [Coprinopsis marcescibilis]
MYDGGGDASPMHVGSPFSKGTLEFTGLTPAFACTTNGYTKPIYCADFLSILTTNADDPTSQKPGQSTWVIWASLPPSTIKDFAVATLSFWTSEHKYHRGNPIRHREIRAAQADTCVTHRPTTVLVVLQVIADKNSDHNLQFGTKPILYLVPVTKELSDTVINRPVSDITNRSLEVHHYCNALSKTGRRCDSGPRISREHSQTLWRSRTHWHQLVDEKRSSRQSEDKLVYRHTCYPVVFTSKNEELPEGDIRQRVGVPESTRRTLALACPRNEFIEEALVMRYFVRDGKIQPTRPIASSAIRNAATRVHVMLLEWLPGSLRGWAPYRRTGRKKCRVMNSLPSFNYANDDVAQVKTRSISFLDTAKTIIVQLVPDRMKRASDVESPQAKERGKVAVASLAVLITPEHRRNSKEKGASDDDSLTTA